MDAKHQTGVWVKYNMSDTLQKRLFEKFKGILIPFSVDRLLMINP